MDDIHQTNARSRATTPIQRSNNQGMVDLTESYDDSRPQYHPDPGSGGSGISQKRKRGSEENKSATPTAASRSYGKQSGGGGSTVRTGSRRRNADLIADIDANEGWLTPTTARTSERRARRSDLAREDASSGHQIETPTRASRTTAGERKRRYVEGSIMSDAERHRRHTLFVKSLLKVYGVGGRVTASKATCRSSQVPSRPSASTFRENATCHKGNEMRRDPDLVESNVDTESSGETASSTLPGRAGSAARSKFSPSRPSRPSTPPRKLLSSVLHRSMAPLALEKGGSPTHASDTVRSRTSEAISMNRESRPEVNDDADLSDWDPFAEDLDIPASPATFAFSEILEIPDTGCRKRLATDDVALLSSPWVARALERDKLKPFPEGFVVQSQPDPSAGLDDDEPVVVDTPTKPRLGRVGGCDDDEDDEADRMLISTPGLASATKKSQNGDEAARPDTATKPLLNSLLKRQARVSPGAHTSPCPVARIQNSTHVGRARNGSVQAQRSTSPHAAKVSCPLCGQEFTTHEIEQHAATCNGTFPDEEPPTHRIPSSTPVSKAAKLEALARKRRRKARGRVEDDIENSSSDEEPAQPSISSYLTRLSEKKKERLKPVEKPAPRQRQLSSRSHAATNEKEEEEEDLKGNEEEEPPVQCKSCGAFIVRSQLRAHQAGCKVKRFEAPPPIHDDDLDLLDAGEPDAWDDRPPPIPSESAPPHAPAAIHVLDSDPGGDGSNEHFWDQSAPLELHDSSVGLDPPRRDDDDDEQLSPLQGFENMDEEDGRLDWFNADNAPAKSAKKTKTTSAKTPSASKAKGPNTYGRGAHRGGWKRNFKRGGGGSGAGRSLPPRR
ncbi:hypothetical protein HDU86_008065 [Geranomyces michiganensis]|nr:hypothetical protein HDU86_008065 [Geranomyces michiganensis]